MLAVMTAVPFFIQSAPSGVALAATQQATQPAVQQQSVQQNAPLLQAASVSGVDLILSKSHISQTFQIGSTVNFTLVVSNQGDTAAGGTITIVDNFPTGLQYTSFTGGEWNCNPASSAVYVPTVTCTWTGTSLAAAVGGVPTTGPLVLSVLVLKTAFPSVTNQAQVNFVPSGSNPDQVNTVNDCANYNGASGNTCPGDTVTVSGAPDVTVSFPNPSQPPTTFVINNPTPITVRVSNIGSADTVGTTGLTISVPPEFTFNTTQPALPSGWSCPTLTGNSASCVYANPIPAVAGGGAAPDITLNVLPTQPLAANGNITAS